MSLCLKPYPDYKDSGVEWLGDVPDHWDLLRLGRLLRERRETNAMGSVTDVLSVMKDVGVIPYAEKGNVGNKKSDDITRYKIVRPDDIVVNCMNVIIGSVGLSRYTGCLSPVYYVLTRRSTADHPHYLGLCFQAKPFQRSLVRIGNGILAHRMRIPMELLKCELLPHPSPDEQAAIVRYLNHTDRQVRRFIRDKQKLIKLLEEQKQVVVNEMVTGQIDARVGEPYAAYNDSGIERIGRVPRHWDVLPLKRVARFKSGAGFPVDEQGKADSMIPFLRVSDMTRLGNEKWIETADSTVTSETARQLGAFVFPANTIIFPKVGGALLTNKRRLLRKASCIDNNVMGCMVADGDVHFVFAMLQQLDLGHLAKPGPVPAIGEGDVREIRVAMPSKSEQAHIVRYLDDAVASSDSAIARTEHEIVLLREYRLRLVADVVTGKLDVREAAASLPDQADEPELVDGADGCVDGAEADGAADSGVDFEEAEA